MLAEVLSWAAVWQGVWAIAVKGPQRILLSDTAPGEYQSCRGHGNKGFLCERGPFTHTCSSPQEILGKMGAAYSRHLAFHEYFSPPGSNLGCRQDGDACALPRAQGKANAPEHFGSTAYGQADCTGMEEHGEHGMEAWACYLRGSQLDLLVSSSPRVC